MKFDSEGSAYKSFVWCLHLNLEAAVANVHSDRDGKIWMTH